MLQRQAALFGERPLLRIARRALDACAMRPQAVGAPRRARWRAAGVQRGDRVAVMCGNRIEFLEVFLGCGWIGAVVGADQHRVDGAADRSTSWPTAGRGCW